MFKQDFTDLTKFLEQQHQKKWLDAMIDSCPAEPTVPPWGNGELIRWFSEYEFIGNWIMSRRPITMEFQRRYHYDNMEKIDGFDPRYHTAVCDAVPDLRLSLQFDWERKEVVNFDYYMNKIRARIIQQLQTELPTVEKNCYWVEPDTSWDDRFKHHERGLKRQKSIEQLKQQEQNAR